MASAKSSRFASSKQCGVGSSIAAALFISPNKPQSTTQPGMRFLNIEVLDDTALIDTSLFSQQSNKATRPRKDWKIKNIKKGNNSYSYSYSYSYSRAEMLALNLHHPHSTKWAQVYRALPAEYDQLLAFSPRPIFTNDGRGATAIRKRRSPLKISVH
ncbi:hypothetical protein SASPL_131393 [Salvia splendens]|uniref:Uncharacterized protein n=1 Tax=Salvia splendens TaxID=180675 RepID=A0A8X8X7R7_SALSN|nr:uncharacterized protein LOC121754194 [Salvia splendens]KAG6408383.1 hypothetical protein SASPL_131393 [Salvia splendens]